jgi:hypothetical protein
LSAARRRRRSRAARPWRAQAPPVFSLTLKTAPPPLTPRPQTIYTHSPSLSDTIAVILAGGGHNNPLAAFRAMPAVEIGAFFFPRRGGGWRGESVREGDTRAQARPSPGAACRPAPPPLPPRWVAGAWSCAPNGRVASVADAGLWAVRPRARHLIRRTPQSARARARAQAGAPTAAAAKKHKPPPPHALAPFSHSHPLNPIPTQNQQPTWP